MSAYPSAYPALVRRRVIDTIPDRFIIANERQQRVRHGMASSGSESIPVGRAFRLSSGQIGRFGWKAHTAHLSTSCKRPAPTSWA